MGHYSTKPKFCSKKAPKIAVRFAVVPYTKLMRTLTKYWFTFIVIFAAHNAEEVIQNLPEWARLHGVFDPFTDRAGFTLAVIALTAAASITGYILERHTSRKSAKVLQVFCWIMIANAIWHLGVSLYFDSVMPGVISAIFMLPVLGRLIIKMRKLASS